MIPIRKFLRICRKAGRRLKLADSSGKEMSGNQVLLNTLVFRNFLRRAILAPDEKFVGVLLPPTVVTTIVNAALTLDQRVAVNLNYTVTTEIMNKCLHTAGITHILTSRKVMDKLNYTNLDAELIILEDHIKEISKMDKIAGLLDSFLPTCILERKLGLTKISPDDLLTVIFTSGSTGVPKGVMLTHHNIMSNIDSFINLERIAYPDRFLGILPSFHAFGYTCNIWCVLTYDIMGVYHYSPLEPTAIGRMCKKYGCTIMVATPTFYRTYVRKVPAEDFASLDFPVTGAERMPIEVMDAFEAKFGSRPLEGFGCTECSPVVAANIPDCRRAHRQETLRKDGSIGMPVPGMIVEVRDLNDSTRVLGHDEVGMMWVKGPNVMKGYLNAPEKTAEVIVDGWYCTGDLAKIDEDGFIFITGRLSRFSKIGGEMVPHEGIESAISSIIGCDPDDPICVAVGAVPDERKGEKIIVLYTDLKGVKPEEIIVQMRQRGLPPIWTPALDAFRQVEQIPILGTGKLDLQGVKQKCAEVVQPKKFTEPK